MKLTIKKTITIADENPAIPHHKFTKGTVVDINDIKLCHRLIELQAATLDEEKMKKEKMVKKDKMENKAMDLDKNKDKKK